MGRSRLGWACNAIAPWCIALGLVVSITAEAGQDPTQGASVVRQGADSPVRQALLSATFHLPGDLFDRTAGQPLAQEARLTLGAPDDLAAVDDEIEPKNALKRAGATLPKIDRTRKGDPFIGLRPGFEARLNHRQARGVGSANSPAVDDNDASLADALGSVESTLPSSEDGADQGPPPWLAGGSAMGGRELSFDDGATPAIPLDIALNSATPQPSDDVPIANLAAKPGSPAETSQIARTMPNGHPDYASLIDPKDSARQQRCLAEAVYFEARSEPEDGQAAVAQVVLNRVRSGLYPANVCAVVYQDRNHPFACQFSFACEGKSLRVTEPGPWAVATRIAKDVADGTIYNPTVGAAVNYHANYVMPYWASTLKRVDRIGHHIFYELRVGQN